jgi:hypothetical protein
LDASSDACMSCVEFCEYTHANGVWWNTECAVSIESCEQLDQCPLGDGGA